MKRYFIHIGITIAIAGILGVIVVFGGLAPINASSGHWPITQWFLDFAKTRSVATHSIGTEVPNLDEEHLIVKGAGLYEMNCSWCHGNPSFKNPRIMAAATPSPPYLVEKVKKYEPEELFYIVKHGVKFTGMPAWPAQERDDEVWAVVAFLLTLPETDAKMYRKMALAQEEVDKSMMPKPGPPENLPHAVTATCAMCHGADGNGRGQGAFPNLAGQKADYLIATLKAYKNGDRHSGAMEPIAARLSDDEIKELATYYADLTLRNSAELENNAKRDEVSQSKQPNDDQFARAKSIVDNGVSKKLVPSCADCHLPGESRSNSHYPRLSGQYADYLELQLNLFQKRHRGGSEYSHLMHPAVDGLTEEQITELARYFSSLPIENSEDNESNEQE